MSKNVVCKIEQENTAHEWTLEVNILAQMSWHKKSTRFEQQLIVTGLNNNKD